MRTLRTKLDLSILDDQIGSVGLVVNVSGLVEEVQQLFSVNQRGVE